ncbi:MAG TPA: type VI secretion system ATPase TssH [Pirellulaceae bacterium]|nr:type VI secretion system ATPase TssH [Pirellulaceae bacterium]
MLSVNQRTLAGKLNGHSRRALEGAAGLCLSRTNYNVEIEHWLMKLLETTGTDLEAILKRFEIDPSHLTRDLTRVLDGLPTGNARSPSLSQKLFDLTQQAWLAASVEFQSGAIRSGHLVYALLADKALANDVRQISGEWAKISPEALLKELPGIVASTLEGSMTEPVAPPGVPRVGDGQPQRPGGRTPALDQYTINLTQRAKEGKIDPVIGRDPEIRQVIDILMRRRQNNPILTGEAGVGKTAVAEGFALLIAAKDVPPPLQNVALHTLDLGLLQAGAGVKGEFEARLKSVIDEVKASPTPIIVFIDEAHTMIGAGGSAGQGDAANLLKPALARGEFRTIAATTWAEYKKYFEKDAALARRFQVVKVEEPTERTAVEMMRGLVATLEKHHGVVVENEAVEEAVRLSHRYISGRQLPDKSVSLLDTTAAAIAISQNAEPPAVQDTRRRIDQAKIALEILGREEELGFQHAEKREALAKELAAAEKNLADLTVRWDKEKELVGKMHDVRRQLTEPAKPEAAAPAGKDAKAPAAPAPTLTDQQRADLKTQYEKLRADLAALQGDSPLVHPAVTGTAIAGTVASWTGIPLGRMLANERRTVLKLKELMEEAIVGQSHALDAIAQTIRTSRAHLGDPGKPIGVFMLAGPSGVGKTETAITLANLLYGGEQNLTVINMSEFKEEHKVSLLMGSPPGYVGYGEGGVLTEAVRRKPYSVILLDEMEKAHPGVQDVFYQVFDKGQMKDGEGRDINFRNSVILMTTNAGTEIVKNLCSDPETRPAADAFTQAVFPKLLEHFKPAFLGRVQVIPYYTLADDVLRSIIKLKLGKIARRMDENYRAKLTWSDDVVENIATRCTEADTGARNIDNILSRTLLPELSAEFLGRLAEGEKVKAAKVTIGDGGAFKYEVT